MLESLYHLMFSLATKLQIASRRTCTESEAETAPAEYCWQQPACRFDLGIVLHSLLKRHLNLQLLVTSVGNILEQQQFNFDTGAMKTEAEIKN